MAADRTERELWSAWLRPVAFCGVLAFCGACLMWGLVKAVSLAVPVAVFVGAITALVLSGETSDNGPSRGATSARRTRLGLWCLHISTACAGIMLILAVISTLVPWLVPFALVALAVTTPPARRWLRAWARRRLPCHARGTLAAEQPVTPGAGPPSDRGPGETLNTTPRTVDLDTGELCHLWRVTFWMVRDLRAPTRTLHVVELRQDVLDELERRHPDEVARWLSSGHHSADGPARYL